MVDEEREKRGPDLLRADSISDLARDLDERASGRVDIERCGPLPVHGSRIGGLYELVCRALRTLPNALTADGGPVSHAQRIPRDNARLSSRAAKVFTTSKASLRKLQRLLRIASETDSTATEEVPSSTERIQRP